MALFKFRWPGQKEKSEQTPVRRSRAAQAESVDDMRSRARHRLIGAAVLVVLGVIGFPILFDSQPRPIPVDVPIEIPDRNQVAPLMVPAEQAQTQPQTTTPDVDGALGQGEELVSNEPAPLAVSKPPEPPRFVPQPVAAPAPTPAASTPVAEPVRPEPKVEPVVKPIPAPATVAKPVVSEAERARALLEGRAPVSSSAPAVAASPKAETGQQARFIVQVGAFADSSKANEVRSKLERAGLKTYTQAVDTKDGKRTRVRVGPFSQRDEADKAAARIKGLGLPASVLTL